MRRLAIVLGLFLAPCPAACSLRRQVTPPSPYCRHGNPLVGVYHPQRLRVKSGCRVAVGIVDKLVSMGARIILCDPHRAVVTGPAKLVGQQMSSPDIRAGMAMLLAALCADGTSTIGNVGEIDRGYERIDERLRSLGARIERVQG